MNLNPSKNRWAVKSPGDPASVKKLSVDLNVEPRIANLLVQRGIVSFEEARDFFRPSLSHLHNPFLMKDMDKAVFRILKALEEGERIMIFGDYDVDGTTAVALVYSFFVKLCPERVSFYIPDRYAEGYGISTAGIDSANENAVTLIIALDCGIRSVEKVGYAAQKGIDFIICDHHLPGAVLPAAVAILDPKQNDCNYPYKELSGCGIGFKLLQALDAELKTDVDIYSWLDLVALSIAADIVPVTGENRVLAYYGLQQINKNPRPGIATILRSGKEIKATDNSASTALPLREYSISDLVFTAAPRINAAGRIDHGKKAVELLIMEEKTDADDAGFGINTSNDKRKDLDKLMTSEALAILESNDLYLNSRSTVLFKPDWHKGVVGIVASRVLEKYYRPTIILTESNGMATGSARSVKDFDIHEAISECSGLLEQFGGHKYAAGMTLKVENVEAFRLRFEEVVSSRITEEQLIREIEIDIELEPDQITDRFYRILKQFAPFGPGNMAPVFVTRGLNDDGNSRVVGSNHLKLKLGKTGKPFYDAIAFGMGEFHPHIQNRIPCDVCYSIEENHWNGRVSLQWMVKDMRF